MTITEQLQFSVLTAPVATLDRRTLSQAWYSALYGKSSTRRTGEKPRRPVVNGTPARAALAHTIASVAMQSRRPIAAPHAAKASTQSEATALERRASRSPLARKIERAFLRPNGAARKASFTVEGDHGRVHVILQAHGTQLKLVAICPPKARPQVAAAIAQARYALALRGIDLEAETRGAQQC